MSSFRTGPRSHRYYTDLGFASRYGAYLFESVVSCQINNQQRNDAADGESGKVIAESRSEEK